jgi:prolyl oligopeptidase
LVGTTLIQNPNYFGAALPAVGVMDMIRFTEFTEGWGWRGDYGYPILDQNDFQRNLKISPYHQTKIDVCYSPTLTTTARRDDRVVPSHSYKFTARLQEYQGCDNPVMLYDAPRAGHGSGNGVAMPKWKRIELFSIEQSFALKNIKQ